MNKSLWRWLLGGLLAVVLLVRFPLTLSAQPAKTGSGPTGDPVTGLIQWQKDGVPLVTAYGNQRQPQIVTDGAGGALAVWEDYRPYYDPFAPADLYAQRVSTDGQTLWQQDGILVAQPGNQTDPRLISDGQGGAIVAWRDDHAGQIYVQRIASDGTLLWAADGVQLSSNQGYHTAHVITSDHAGGAIVAWNDYDESQVVSPIVYMQHIRADGTLAWTIGGITVTSAWHGQFYPQIASDGAGGAILAWAGDCARWSGLCVQRVLSDGSLAWGNEGAILSVSSEPLYHQSQLLADGAGGATVVWVDIRNLNDDLYAQKVTSDGTAVWAGGGVPVIVADGDQQLPRIASDGHGGIIVAWHDTRRATLNVDLQRLDANGRALWNPAGVTIATQRIQTTFDGECHYDLIADGAGGAMVSWQENVSAVNKVGNGIWLQRLSAEGVPIWSGRGALVQVDWLNNELSTPRILSESVGDVIVVWQDNRHGYKNDNFDIYAQRVIEGSYRYYFPNIAR